MTDDNIITPTPIIDVAVTDNIEIISKTDVATDKNAILSVIDDNIDVDDLITDHIGGFGIYQKFLFGYLCLSCVFLAHIAFGQVFMQIEPMEKWCTDQFRCLVGSMSSMTSDQRQNLTLPFMATEQSCALNDFDHKYLASIFANEKNARLQGPDQVCMNATSSCIFNGTHWYSEQHTGFYKHDFTLPSSITPVGGNKMPLSCTVTGITIGKLLPTTLFIFHPLHMKTQKTLESCKNYEFERHHPGFEDFYYPTIITEGRSWWCHTEFYIACSQSVFFVGAIVGGVVLGELADRFGRVPAFVIANLIGGVGGILSTFTTDFYLFSFFRFLTGLAYDNCFTMMYILALEFTGPIYRTMVANLSIAIFFTIGTVTLPWIARYIANWRTFGRVIAAPMLLVVISIFVVPESSRWLLSKGKTKRATNILRLFAKVNRKKVDEKIFVDFEKGAKKLYDQVSKLGPEPSIWKALQKRRLRKTIILLVLIYSCTALVYDGHNRNILNLANDHWNLFWMFSLAAMTEFPADVFMILTLDRFGRRWLSFAALSLSGIFSFIAATIPVYAWTPTVVMAIISRFWVNVAFNIALQYASELLPTVIRAQGVSIIHIMGYVASIFSPFIAQLGHHHPVASLLILGTAALFGGILSLFLPETLGEDLPDTLQDAETFGSHQSFWNCPFCDNSRPKPVEEKRTVVVEEERAVLVEEEETELVEGEETLLVEESKSGEGSGVSLPTVSTKMRNSMRPPSRGDTYRSTLISRRSLGARDHQSVLMWMFS